jgi:dCMP deaminase
MTDWDARWLDLARNIGSWSKDRSTKVGCVIAGSANQILAAGYNGFPRGVDDDVDERHDRPGKYLWTEHAERNALYNAARHGVGLLGATIYVPWHPCADCARGVIQSGIMTLVTAELPPDDSRTERWGDQISIARIMLLEAGVLTRIASISLAQLPRD